MDTLPLVSSGSAPVDPMRALLNAILANDAPALRLAVSHGCDVNGELPDRLGRPLYRAAYHRLPHIVSVLLELGADARLVGCRITEDTALQAAILSDNAEIIQTLLDHGVTSQDRDVSLHMAVAHRLRDTVDLLLTHRADVEYTCPTRPCFPLLQSMSHGASGIPELLLEFKANVNCLDAKTRRTPLHLACLKGCATAVNLLIDHGADLEALDKDFNTPLSLACRSRIRGNAVRILAQRGANVEVKCHRGETPLSASCRLGLYENVDRLLEARADIEACGMLGDTPLLAASMARFVPHSICERLLKRHASVNATLPCGSTALHLVQEERIVYQFTDIGLMLLRHGADIDARDLLGNTPLHRAAEVGYLRNATLLIKRGADRTIKNVNGMTAEQTATDPEVAAAIRDHMFLWSPTAHRLIRRRKPAFCRTILALLLVRNAAWGEGVDAAGNVALPWLPNELMFEIFAALF